MKKNIVNPLIYLNVYIYVLSYFVP